jgi:predicted MFS family arabinose efflux permease
MSWLMTAFSFASIVGVPLSLYLARFFEWHAPFYFIVFMGVIVLPAIIHYVPSVKSHINAKHEGVNIMMTLKNVFSIPAQRAAMLFSGTLMLGHFLIIPFINPYMEFNNGFSKTQTPMIYLVGGLTTLLSAVVWGRLADHYGKLRIFTIAGFLSVIPVLIVTNLPHWPFGLVLVPFAFWFAMTNGRTISAQAMVSQVVPPQTRGSFMSFNSSMQQLFTGAASTFAGFIISSDQQNRILHYERLGFISVAIILLCLVLARRLKVE